MALKTTYEFQGQEYPEAYIRIQKLAIGISEIDKEVDHGHKITIEFDTVTETLAFAMVYANEDARRNNVRPINRIGFQFKYDVDSGKNIIKEAYIALKADLSKNNKVEDI